jgi:hypothetical protein
LGWWWRRLRNLKGVCAKHNKSICQHISSIWKLHNLWVKVHVVTGKSNNIWQFLPVDGTSKLIWYTCVINHGLNIWIL